ncbi:DUF4879 domain-containing protein [uncultured Helicobacter sp.]|uniref:DUF4879 domain-containing protein n=1 Tax=uncultured Helicobacter sp. TaxID=175537 RepID=UPI00260FD373|nr:DUF4879 domain-containing protein [uncultured Helicobacter sp.]
MKKAYEANKNNKAVKAAAPPVSEVGIMAVCSQQQVGQLQDGCENIQDNQTSTNFNHGGNPFQVVTGVVGYGGRNTDSATFAGNQATMIDCVGIAEAIMWYLVGGNGGIFPSLAILVVNLSILLVPLMLVPQ